MNSMESAENSPPWASEEETVLEVRQEATIPGEFMAQCKWITFNRIISERVEQNPTASRMILAKSVAQHTAKAKLITLNSVARSAASHSEFHESDKDGQRARWIIDSDKGWTTS